MKLSLAGLKYAAYAQKGYLLPNFDIDAMRQKTLKNPTWIHFGAGNILRAFPCVLLQRLLEAGETDRGMIVVESYDEEIIDKAFTSFDNLCLAVSLRNDGTVEKRIVASVAQALGYHHGAQERVTEIFRAPGLQMVTLTITEKGYAVLDAEGKPLSYCAKDFESMESPVSTVGILTKLLFARYQAGKLPIAMVSLDNCSHNGTLLQHGVAAIAAAWADQGLVDADFVAYLTNNQQVAFTWSMIDKITPRPSQEVLEMLNQDGFEGAELVVTSRNTYVSGMVNAEECEYLAIEDHFPNGRPPLEKVGVLFGDRETIDRMEKMKVCTCLNPLHTCLAVFGCMLSYRKISDEMKDAALTGFIHQIGYVEGLPVVVDPKIMSAVSFMNEVVSKRLPNPFVPDTPQRIACDTSKKIPVRFGETLKAYLARGEKDLSFLTFIPLMFAGYARYLTGIGDDGKPFEISPDPNLAVLKPLVADFVLGKPFDTSKLVPLFSNADIFGVDLYQVGLGEKAQEMFTEMGKETGAIRKTIDAYLARAKE